MLQTFISWIHGAYMCKIHQLDTCAYLIFVRYSNIHINTIFVTCFFTCADIEYSISYWYEAPSKGCWYETLRDGEKSHSLRREPFGNWKLPGNHDSKNVGHELHHGLFSNNNGYCPKSPRTLEKKGVFSPKELVTSFFSRDSLLHESSKIGDYYHWICSGG